MSQSRRKVGDYIIGQELGKGSWGRVHVVKHGPTGKLYAAKFEKKDTSQLKFEYDVLMRMRKLEGFARPITFTHTQGHEVLVMDKLGASIGKLFLHCGPFNLKTVLLLGIQLVERLAALHDQGVVYRDIKPENILIGRRRKCDVVHIVDFGLSSIWREPHSGLHIPCSDTGRLVGTPRYASINAHFGLSTSRRDDLESLGYMLVYFIKGKLPWQNLKVKRGESKLRKIGELKGNKPLAELCAGLPDEFAKFIEYSRSLEFSQRPDYTFLVQLFKNRFLRERYDMSGNSFEWMLQLKLAAKTRYRRHSLTENELLQYTPDQLEKGKKERHKARERRKSRANKKKLISPKNAMGTKSVASNVFESSCDLDAVSKKVKAKKPVLIEDKIVDDKNTPKSGKNEVAPNPTALPSITQQVDEANNKNKDNIEVENEPEIEEGEETKNIKHNKLSNRQLSSHHPSIISPSQLSDFNLDNSTTIHQKTFPSLNPTSLSESPKGTPLQSPKNRSSISEGNAEDLKNENKYLTFPNVKAGNPLPISPQSASRRLNNNHIYSSTTSGHRVTLSNRPRSRLNRTMSFDIPAVSATVAPITLSHNDSLSQSQGNDEANFAQRLIGANSNDVIIRADSYKATKRRSVPSASLSHQLIVEGMRKLDMEQNSQSEHESPSRFADFLSETAAGRAPAMSFDSNMFNPLTSTAVLDMVEPRGHLQSFATTASFNMKLPEMDMYRRTSISRNIPSTSSASIGTANHHNHHVEDSAVANNNNHQSNPNTSTIHPYDSSTHVPASIVHADSPHKSSKKQLSSLSSNSKRVMPLISSPSLQNSPQSPTTRVSISNTQITSGVTKAGHGSDRRLPVPCPSLMVSTTGTATENDINPIMSTFHSKSVTPTSAGEMKLPQLLKLGASPTAAQQKQQQQNDDDTLPRSNASEYLRKHRRDHSRRGGNPKKNISTDDENNNYKNKNNNNGIIEEEKQPLKKLTLRAKVKKLFCCKVERAPPRQRL
eukprot:TRINITY_DN132828_c0_g1_i1.p1 TRINITY_DN132828_c0_g1~~TRINITY_DN132828_c0_g1_i1.p1  ORF type:complete len:998 (+),score=262.00 TRINITY_DN132828_c0_g1_i1:152-3145(+)